jgi:hypothetical protein
MYDDVAKERNLCTAGRTLAGSVILLLYLVLAKGPGDCFMEDYI